MTLPVAVLAGGLGTRVRHRTGPRLPKVLLPVAGVPFIDLKLRELRDGGAARVILLVGHGGSELEEHVGDGAAYGLELEVLHDPPELLGTGGALRRAVPRLGPEFIVTYGDTLLEVPMDRLVELLVSSSVGAVMTVLRNDDRWETSNVDVADEFVTTYEKPAMRGRHRFLDYGMLAMRARAFDAVESQPTFDLADVLRVLVSRRDVRALPVSRRFYDIGNEESLLETERFIRASQTAR